MHLNRDRAKVLKVYVETSVVNDTSELLLSGVIPAKCHMRCFVRYTPCPFISDPQ